MAWREVLQTEIWSKQTSRRIWKVLGCWSVTTVVLGAAFIVVELKWLTPQERSVARNALAEIESLRKSLKGDEAEYRSRKEDAEAGAALAESQAWTRRDRKLAELLRGYLFMIEMEYEEPRMEARSQEFHRRHPERTASETDSDRAQRLQTGRQVREFVGKVLHDTLD